MKSLWIIACVLLLAGVATAQEWIWYGGQMGVYFSETEFNPATTNLDTSPGVPFYFYIVLRDAQVATVGGYECSFEYVPAEVFVLAVIGRTEGFINFGTIQNHLVGFGEPLPVDGNGDAVFCDVLNLYLGSDPVDLVMGPSDPSTGDPDHNPWGYTWNGPLIGDGIDPDILLCCHLTSGAAGYPDVVATLNALVVATESQTLTQVRRLFD
jgi:hypothetical protein